MLTPKCDPFPPIQRVKGQYPWESAKHCSQSGKHYTQGRTQSASNVQRVYAEYMPVHPLYTHCSHVYYWRVHRVYRWYTRDTQIYREESVHRYTQIYREYIDYVQRGERECAHLYGGVYVINALIKPPFCTQMIYSKRHREYIEGVQRVQKICQESIYTCIGYNYRREAVTFQEAQKWSECREAVHIRYSHYQSFFVWRYRPHDWATKQLGFMSFSSRRTFSVWEANVYLQNWRSFQSHWCFFSVRSPGDHTLWWNIITTR